MSSNCCYRYLCLPKCWWIGQFNRNISWKWIIVTKSNTEYCLTCHVNPTCPCHSVMVWQWVLEIVACLKSNGTAITLYFGAENEYCHKVLYLLQRTGHYLKQCWPNSLTHICITRGWGGGGGGGMSWRHHSDHFPPCQQSICRNISH